MNSMFVLVFCFSIIGSSLTQNSGQSGTGDNSSGNSGNSGTNSGTTGANNGDGSQGYNQGYSYNTGIRPYQTGFTFYQPFGDAANAQNNAGAQNTGAKTGAAPAQAPVAQPQPIVPIGYQPVYAVQQGVSPVQPVQFQNAPQIVHFGQLPAQGVQPIPVQPIQLPNFDLDGFGLGGNTQNNNNNNNNRRQSNNRRVSNAGAAPFNPADFGLDLGGVGGGGNNNNNNNNNGFFSPPNNNNGYDSLPDDSSLANFANLGGGGGQSNDYPDNDFGNLGDFGSATQNRGTFDILPNFGNGFFRRK